MLISIYFPHYIIPINIHSAFSFFYTSRWGSCGHRNTVFHSDPHFSVQTKRLVYCRKVSDPFALALRSEQQLWHLGKCFNMFRIFWTHNLSSKSLIWILKEISSILDTFIQKLFMDSLLFLTAFECNFDFRGRPYIYPLACLLENVLWWQHYSKKLCSNMLFKIL